MFLSVMGATGCDGWSEGCCEDRLWVKIGNREDSAIIQAGHHGVSQTVGGGGGGGRKFWILELTGFTDGLDGAVR